MEALARALLLAFFVAVAAAAFLPPIAFHLRSGRPADPLPWIQAAIGVYLIFELFRLGV